MGCHGALGVAQGVGLRVLAASNFTSPAHCLWGDSDVPQGSMVGGVYTDDTGLIARVSLEQLGSAQGPDFALVSAVDDCHDSHNMAQARHKAIRGAP